MKRVTIALLGLMLVMVTSCKKAEKIEIAKPTNRIVSTIAGAGIASDMDGIGQRAGFRSPGKVATDASGNIYIADLLNHKIKKMTSDGSVTTLAGNGQAGYVDGTGTAAQFNQPWGLDVDGNGNIYVADGGNNCIRKITPSGVVTTLAGMAGNSGFADGSGSEVRFNFPADIVFDKSNNMFFIADNFNNRIRKMSPSGVVTTYVGNGQTNLQDGPIATATMAVPSALTIDPSGNMYVAQYSFIRKITPDGFVSIVAGNTDLDRGFGYIDGSGLGALFYFIYDIASDKEGNIYVADSDNNLIRRINPEGIVSTYAGTQYIPGANSTKYNDGPANQSYFARPQGLTVDREGNVIIAETDGNRIRKISEVPIPESPEEIARKNWNNPTGWK